MPVTLAQPPEAVTELTRSKIQEIAQRRDFRVESLVAAAPDQISLSSGHPVYNLGLRDLLDGKPLAQRAITSWRFIVQNNNAESTAAETLSGGASGPAAFSSVNAGPFVQGTQDAFAAVSADPTFAAGDWEMRLLRIPALFILAVWTHDQSGEGDRLVPIEPAPSYLGAGKTYSWSEFLTAVRPYAEARLKTDDSPKG
jgi:hypothetical protein